MAAEAVRVRAETFDAIAVTVFAGVVEFLRRDLLALAGGCCHRSSLKEQQDECCCKPTPHTHLIHRACAFATSCSFPGPWHVEHDSAAALVPPNVVVLM